MIDRLNSWARSRGYRVAWGPPALVRSVRDDVSARIASGEIDATLAREQLSSFCFDVPRDLDRSWTVLLVAMPRPAHRVTFTVSGRPLHALIPVTYVRYRAVFEDIRADLRATALAGARVERLDIPLKPLAALLGVARYGRNNLTYVEGLVSYFQLAGYITTARLPIALDWSAAEPQLLDECEDCSICEAVCPTGAIRGSRVLLHAENCVTFANENPAPLPAWVTAGAQTALIGCLQCQQHCPANPPLRVEDTGLVFSEAETAGVMGASDSPLGMTESVRARLGVLGLTEERVIGRNLRALVRR
jgi:epoxyqueuosine reductase